MQSLRVTADIIFVLLIRYLLQRACWSKPWLCLCCIWLRNNNIHLIPPAVIIRRTLSQTTGRRVFLALSRSPCQKESKTLAHQTHRSTPLQQTVVSHFRLAINCRARRSAYVQQQCGLLAMTCSRHKCLAATSIYCCRSRLTENLFLPSTSRRSFATFSIQTQIFRGTKRFCKQKNERFFSTRIIYV